MEERWGSVKSLRILIGISGNDVVLDLVGVRDLRSSEGEEKDGKVDCAALCSCRADEEGGRLAASSNHVSASAER